MIREVANFFKKNQVSAKFTQMHVKYGEIVGVVHEPPKYLVIPATACKYMIYINMWGRTCARGGQFANRLYDDADTGGFLCLRL